MSFVRRHRLAVLAASALLVPVLAGCAPERAPITETSAPTSAASSDPGVAPPADDAQGTPIDRTCTDLISLQQMYDYNPNFLLVPSYTAEPDSAAIEAFGYRGLVCAWQNSSSGEIISVAVADLPSTVFSTVRSAAKNDGDPVSVFGAEGYFSTAAGTGRAEAFTGSYWIVAESPWFLEAQDAAPLMTAAITALGG